MMAIFISVQLETSGGRTIEYSDHCHPNLLMYKLLTRTGDEYESDFVRYQGNRDSQLKCDQERCRTRSYVYDGYDEWSNWFCE